MDSTAWPPIEVGYNMRLSKTSPLSIRGTHRTVALAILLFFASLLIPHPGYPPAAGSVTGDQYPGSGDWMIYNNTTVSGEAVHLTGNLTVGPGINLTITDSTLYMEGNGSVVNVTGELYLENTTIRCEPNLTWTLVVYGSAVAAGSEIHLGWEMTGSLGSSILVRDSVVVVEDNLWVPASYIGSQGNVSFVNVSFLPAGNQSYVIHFASAWPAYNNTAVMEGCRVSGGGIPYGEMGSIYYPTDAAVYSETALTLRNTTVENGKTGCVAVSHGGLWVEGCHLASSTFGVDVLFSSLHVEDTTIYNTSMGVGIRNSPPALGDPALSVPEIEDSTITGGEYGVLLLSSHVAVRNSTVANNSLYGVYGINSLYDGEGNDYSTPSANGIAPVAVFSSWDVSVFRDGSIPIHGATVSVKETGWQGYTEFGTVALNGSAGLLLYQLDENGREVRPDYTVNVTWNDGLKDYHREWTVNYSSIPEVEDRGGFRIFLPAGPDLALTNVTVSTTEVSPGGTFFVDITVENLWCYPAENVEVEVQPPWGSFNTTIGSIPANGTATVQIEVTVPDMYPGGTFSLDVWVDPAGTMEGHYIDLTNNHERVDMEVLSYPSGTLPTLSLAIAFAILLFIFLVSLVRGLRGEGREAEEEKEEEETGTEEGTGAGEKDEAPGEEETGAVEKEEVPEEKSAVEDGDEEKEIEEKERGDAETEREEEPQP
ncbi:MAG: hypothetical protein J7L61_04520 [Thermoplasmata archaeon]|nr:hypothetical protein [Thermoplasmata archaeon]